MSVVAKWANKFYIRWIEYVFNPSVKNQLDKMTARMDVAVTYNDNTYS